ncbi:hypothetical protein Hs30E_13890 [Lactococcus hodotermopsidis]|uniref:Uncharacterized protein n=1 Tax=Pseudolactococcus hodotermopsidis TaxID=2709157 RepID=A0A6A0BES6_9LACT|nr:hypothetical protein [Lactococcus hodotermopsidis]GFH42838.1 hypothetical protein Hs30E_13890 [Lactococcus hodotermopsidis]
MKKKLILLITMASLVAIAIAVFVVNSYETKKNAIKSDYGNIQVTIKYVDQISKKTIKEEKKEFVSDGKTVYVDEVQQPGYIDEDPDVGKIAKNKGTIIFYQTKAIKVTFEMVDASGKNLQTKVATGAQNSSQTFNAPATIGNNVLDGNGKQTVKFDKDKTITIKYKAKPQSSKPAASSESQAKSDSQAAQSSDTASDTSENTVEPPAPDATVVTQQQMQQEADNAAQAQAQAQASGYDLDITAPNLSYVPATGYGMWMPNYVVAHNPGSGAAFLNLHVGSRAKINGSDYTVSEIYLIWGPPETYPGSTDAKRYKDVNTGADRSALIFDGRMTLQTCADGGYSQVWIYKLAPA